MKCNAFFKFLISSFCLTTFLSSCNSNVISITFDSCGGTLSGESVVKVNKGAKYKDINKPYVSKSGYKLECWSLSKQDAFQIPENYEFNKNTTVYAHYLKDIKSFEFDTWSNVIDSINKGSSDLISRYGLNDLNDLIGKKKTIKIKDLDYTAIVIGTKHEDIAGAYNKKSILTFQITDLYEKSIYQNGSNSYLASEIRSKCNYIFNNINDEKIRNNIKTVNKKTFEGGGTNRIADYNEKLFIPSYSEVGGGDLSGKKEENVYDYYLNSAISKRPKDSWLRTPSTQNATDAYFIDLNGSIATSHDFSANRNCNPCFSLGEETFSDATFYHTNWETISSIANSQGLEGLKSRFATDSFIGYTHPVKVKDDSGNDKIYTVKVIGENEDRLANEASNNKYAALTFMFIDPILISKFSNSNYNNYKNSLVKEKLENLYLKFDSQLINNIKDVIRYTYVGDTIGEKKLEESYEKLIIPSAIELGITSSELSGQTKPNIFYEGQTYSYFAKRIDDIDLKYRRLINYPSDINSYYLRSCNSANVNQMLSIANDGTILNSTTEKELAICPIFSIGVSSIDNTKFKFVSNSIDSSFSDLGYIRLKNDQKYTTKLSIKSSYAIGNHNQMPTSFDIALKGSTGKSILLANNDYAYNSSTNLLIINSVNELSNKYKNILGVINEVIAFPEVVISDNDTWQVIMNNKDLNYYPIGATKSIKIDNENYECKIIANKENIVEGETKASLTFMISSPITNTKQLYYENGSFTSKWGDDSSTSPLKSKYNTYKQKIEDENSGIAIQTVQLNTTWFDYKNHESTQTITSNNNTVFALSYSEAFDQNISKRYSYFQNNPDLFFVKNIEYKYYFRDSNLHSIDGNNFSRFSYVDNYGIISNTDINDSNVYSNIPESNLLLCFCI